MDEDTYEDIFFSDMAKCFHRDLAFVAIECEKTQEMGGLNCLGFFNVFLIDEIKAQSKETREKK
jgi:hypothetical protein